MSSRERLLAAASSPVLLLIAGAGELVGASSFRSAVLATLLLFTWASAPCLLMGAVSWSRHVLWTVSTSLSTTCALGFLMAEVRTWYPSVAMVAILGASLVASARVWAGDRPARTASRQRTLGPWTSTTTVWALTALAAALVLVGSLKEHLPGPEGLRVDVAFWWYLGVVVLLATVGLAYRNDVSPGPPIVLLCVTVVLAQAMVYGAPTVMTAARHVGVVDYVRVHHSLEPSLDIYQAWAALFAGAAFVCDATGISNPMNLATWWPVPLSAALVVGVRVLAGAVGMSSRRAWGAAAVFGLGNTLNITYFSPQSMGLLLALALFSCALDGRPVGREATGWWLKVVLFASVCAVTHQISPYFITAGLGVLVLLRVLRPWWIVAVPLVPAFLWAVANRSTLGGFVSIEALGRLFDNVRPPEHPAVGEGGPAAVTRLAFNVPAVVLVAIGLTAVVTVLLRRSRRELALLVTAASPSSLFAVSDYGQEGIFRVALFALPWLALLAVQVPWRRALPPTPALVAALVLMFMVNVFGQTTMDWARIVRPDAAAAVAAFERQAAPGAVLLLTGTGNATPSKQTARYIDVRYTSREAFYPVPPGRYDAAADLAAMTQALLRYVEAPAYYALVSDSIGAYDERYSGQEFVRHLELRAAMRTSRQWQLVSTGPTTQLYRLRAPATDVGRDP